MVASISVIGTLPPPVSSAVASSCGREGQPHFPVKEWKVNDLFCRGVQPGFLLRDGCIQVCLAGSGLQLLRHHAEGGMPRQLLRRAGRILRRVQPDVASALRQLVQVALSSSRCVTEAKTVAVSLTDLPGLSTHPWPT
jgi:hypothetical protein